MRRRLVDVVRLAAATGSGGKAVVVVVLGVGDLVQGHGGQARSAITWEALLTPLRAW